jgi:EEF1A lysine methyltransferase 1
MATTIKDDDDDAPALSAHALEALREFITDQREKTGNGKVELVPEDWRLSQFWYDRRTAETLVEEIRFLSTSSIGSPPPSVACIACPTLYACLKVSLSPYLC